MNFAGDQVQVLDKGYVRLVESWGSDEAIIRAARMSTQKGFKGWGGSPCPDCWTAQRLDTHDGLYKTHEHMVEAEKSCKCKGTGKTEGDEKLLKYLWDHKHATPFEMAGFTLEVKAPIFVIREWQRHRTFSYNEMSSRYTELPAEDYVPNINRLLNGGQSASNKQGSGTQLDAALAEAALIKIQTAYRDVQYTYAALLGAGVARELARLVLPVARYSVMRTSGNLRNWLHFLKLRCASNAQWEIRMYANEVWNLVEALYPHTAEVAKGDTL